MNRWDIKITRLNPHDIKGPLWNPKRRARINADSVLKKLESLGVHQVLTVDPRPLLVQVENLGRYMAREGGYSPLYTVESVHSPRSPLTEAFLFSSDRTHEIDSYGVGACCFRWRKWSDHAPGWALQWVWLHPFERSHGVLTAAWPEFKSRFGDFLVEGPLSGAMRRFVAKTEAASSVPP
jgi:hypothetical protein